MFSTCLLKWLFLVFKRQCSQTVVGVKNVREGPGRDVQTPRACRGRVLVDPRFPGFVIAESTTKFGSWADERNLG